VCFLDLHDHIRTGTALATIIVFWAEIYRNFLSKRKKIPHQIAALSPSKANDISNDPTNTATIW
jgi:hypothetical protein